MKLLLGKTEKKFQCRREAITDGIVRGSREVPNGEKMFFALTGARSKTEPEMGKVSETECGRELRQKFLSLHRVKFAAQTQRRAFLFGRQVKMYPFYIRWPKRARILSNGRKGENER